MLQHLYIQNYALIRELDINFSEGFSVITGETGAGKSIILGALGLLMGERADVKSIREGAAKCILEAEFTCTSSIINWLRNNDLDEYSQLPDLPTSTPQSIKTALLRREISANGKSRAFINDTPVNLSLLKELGNQLIDINSQHSNLLLQDDTFQLALVDAMADNQAEKEAYQAAYQQYKAIEKQLSQLQQTNHKLQQEADYIRFQHTQLQEAKIQKGEETALEKELSVLSHTEDIKSNITLTLELLSEENQALCNIKDALSNLQKINNFLPKEDNLYERLHSLYIELKDIIDSLDTINEQTEYNPQRLAQVEERLDLINSLLQKHRLTTANQLLQLQDDFSQQLQQMSSLDEEIQALQRQQRNNQMATSQAASQLTASRKKVLPFIEQHLINELTTLGIPNANCQLQLRTQTSNSNSPIGGCGATGQDDIQLLFSANKNGTLRNVAEVASGGEISRLMLCIKALLAQKQELPTLVFDEIDTGVSGDIASRMGHIMQQMGKQMQVISITHLPQIAALGSNHYKVYKTDNENFTETHIAHLIPEQRIQEVAQMLSGNTITDAAIHNAKELLSTLLTF